MRFTLGRVVDYLEYFTLGGVVFDFLEYIQTHIFLLVESLLITLNTFQLSSALLCFVHILNSENVQPCTKHAFVCKCAGAAVVQAPEIQLSVNCNSEQDFFAIA